MAKVKNQNEELKNEAMEEQETANQEQQNDDQQAETCDEQPKKKKNKLLCGLGIAGAAVALVGGVIGAVVLGKSNDEDSYEEDSTGDIDTTNE